MYKKQVLPYKTNTYNVFNCESGENRNALSFPLNVDTVVMDLKSAGSLFHSN